MKSQLQKSNINLLPEDLKGVSGLRFFKGIAVRVSLVLLGIYLTFTLALFLAIFFFSRQAIELENKKTTLVSNLESTRNKEGLWLALKNRIGLAKTSIMATREVILPSESINNVLAVLPSDVQLKNIENTGKKNVFLTVSTPDSKAVLNFLTILENDKRFSLVLLNTLALTEDGIYSLSLEIK